MTEPLRKSSKTAVRAGAFQRSLVLMPLCICFILGAVILINREQPRGATRKSAPALNSARTSLAAEPNKSSAVGLATKESAGVVASSATTLSARSTIAEANVSAVGVKDLLIPVAGVASNQLRDSFYDSRSEGRVHAALDIMAPHDTPVLAADDGTVMKLHQSGRGGIMLYQADRSGAYVFYYGHLSHYADGISEGKALRRGEVIGYVGDTGNAAAGNFHLHFGISRMTAAGRWYGGEPINPYPLLQGNSAPTLGGK